jgi:hypothetical protein
MKVSKLLFLSILITLLTSFGFAQDKVTISGSVIDASTGEDLIGATVFDQNSSKGAVTNTYGFFSLTLKKGYHKIAFSFIGYENVMLEGEFSENKHVEIKLKSISTELSTVEITAKRKDENLISTDIGIERLDMKKVESIPVIFGEKDVLKSIQLLPGISSTSEGSSGFSVRGGSIDQNLILLDEAPVYSASHLMGFFSVFNSDALKNMSVYKGGIPANYGGRASSVLDITMKEGNNQEFQTSGGIGLISSRLTVEGPILKDKVSFIASGRRSYADLVAKAAGLIDNDVDLYFYDFNAKINYKVNENNRLFLSGYFGRDDFGFGTVGMDWGNTTSTFRWNHIFNEKLFSNTTLIYSNYDYAFNLGETASMASGIEDYGFKEDLTYYLNPSYTLKFGLHSTYHNFDPGQLDFGEDSDMQLLMDEKKALESALYLMSEHKVSDKFSIDYGVRFSLFNQIGEGYNYSYADDNSIVDSVYFDNGEIMQSYYNFEPRVSMNYRLSKSTSLKASYNRTAQYLQLLSNSTSGQPNDTWMPSTFNLKPVLADQFAVGYFQNFLDNNYEFSVEAYYKNLQNVSDYEDGTDLMFNDNIEAQILTGRGRSYGAEFYLKKKYGRFNGWISYTLSKTQTQIDGINNNEWYDSKYDKTHDISVVGSYDITDRVKVSASWVYYTGNAVTFPSGRYDYDGEIMSYYTERNGYRMPDYHRLDLGVQIKGKEHKRFKSSWDFSIYNAYNRYNAYSISFQESESNPGATEAVQMSLFGIVPSVTWNFKF